MAAIDIGPGCADRANVLATQTMIDLANPANAAGKLSAMKLWCTSNLAGCKIGSFYGAGTDYTSRDYETIGAVTSGSEQTFSGLDCDVESGDYLGTYFSSGFMELGTSGGAGVYFKSGDQFGAGLQTYSLGANYVISIYGQGATPSLTPQIWIF